MRNFILGTDWWTDCDDVVAARLLLRFVNQGKVNLLGIGINACMQHSVASLVGFLRAEGLDNVPVGIDLTATDYVGNPPYQKGLAERYAPDVTNTDVMDAARLYRKLLAEADGKVEIIEIGFLQVISAVLQSGPDDISSKSGLELFSEKVSKVWVMAGKWDADGEKEHNFCITPRSRAAGKQFCELCPVPVTFLGWEVGYQVISGDRLDKQDHLYHVLVDHGSQNGRHSWDPMLVLMALIGDESAAGYDTVSGFATVDEVTGANYFRKDSDGKHKFVIKKYDNAYYAEMINQLL